MITRFHDLTQAVVWFAVCVAKRQQTNVLGLHQHGCWRPALALTFSTAGAKLQPSQHQSRPKSRVKSYSSDLMSCWSLISACAYRDLPRPHWVLLAKLVSLRFNRHSLTCLTSLTSLTSLSHQSVLPVFPVFPVCLTSLTSNNLFMSLPPSSWSISGSCHTILTNCNHKTATKRLATHYYGLQLTRVTWLCFSRVVACMTCQTWKRAPLLHISGWKLLCQSSMCLLSKDMCLYVLEDESLATFWRVRMSVYLYHLSSFHGKASILIVASRDSAIDGLWF